MLAEIFYWGLIFINIAWIAISLYFSIFCFARKENGNLWAFGFFNVLSFIVLALLIVVYHTWGWGITQYSNFVYLLMAILAVMTVLQAFLGKEPKSQTAN